MFKCTHCQHQCNQAPMEKGSHGRPLYGTEKAWCSLFQIVRVESLRTDKMRKLSFCAVVLLRLPLQGLSLKSFIVWNLAFNVEMVIGVAPHHVATWFCWTPVWSCRIAQALARSIKHDMHHLTALAGSMLTGAANKVPNSLQISRTWGTRLSKQESIAAEGVWH